ncbi:uncharacterized protein [Diadema antillarum]|uniref:uncharacterized protein n=2 Tax=Diadema antillarum TaxID=105358 RepID=UPI003A869944
MNDMDGGEERSPQPSGGGVQPDDVRPEDSVSQCGSKASSTSSRLKAMAKRAALEAEAAALEEQQLLELQELQLKQRKSQLKLRTELRIAKAEEDIYQQAEASSTPVESPDAKGRGDDTLPYPVGGVTSLPAIQMLQQGQQQLVDTLRLPQVQLMKFDGNPLRYWEFWKGFEVSVDRVNVDDTEKLTRLLHYCIGEPRKLLQACVIMPPEQGYQKAKQLLKQRFGNSVSIADAWMKRITEGGRISPHDGKALTELADDMTVCSMSMKAMGFESELSPQSVLLAIVGRLPSFIRGRWLTRVAAIRSQDRVPRFDDLLEFVRAMAVEQNDPVYSRGNLPEEKSPRQGTTVKSQRSSRPKASFAVSSTSKEALCVRCSGRHQLLECQQFQGLTPKERLGVARKERLCFNCLKPGHMVGNCQLKRTCQIDGCGRKHATLLHVPASPTRAQPEPSQQGVGSSEGEPVEAQNGYSVATGHATGAGSQKVVLPIVPVSVQAKGGTVTVQTYALLDSGSTSTFCTEDLVMQLGVTGKRQVLAMSTLEKARSQVETMVTSLVVQNPDMSHAVDLPTVYTRKSLNISTANVARAEDIDSYRHLSDLDFPCVHPVNVELLIGQDVPEAVMPLEVRSGGPGEPYATKTALGWALQGPLKTGEKGDVCAHFISNTALEEQVKRFWTLESTESLCSNEKAMSVNDKRVLKVWNDTVSMSHGHYELPIPFKEEPVKLPDNRHVALCRLESLRKKLQSNVQLHQKYSCEVAALLEKGYAEEVRYEDANARGPVWYLPHHGVLNPNKPDKLRIVFDCASKCQGKALNDVVHQGPDMTNNLLGVLLRFRQEPVAVMGDIKEMFHQVRVPPDERDMLRFLWWPEGNLSESPRTYRMCVHLFGGTWSPSCCSYALRHTAEEFKEEFSVAAVRSVKQNFYVDDCLVSSKTEEEAIQLVNELTRLLEKGGFRLMKWISNRPGVIQAVSVEQRAKTVIGLDLDHDALPVERALGVTWDTEHDCFMYQITPRCKPLTRRGILSEIASIYDPYGFAAPFVMNAKMLLQELTALKLGFDDPIPAEHRERWLKWKECLPEMSKVKVSRCLNPAELEGVTAYELHHFSDASERGYGVVSYLRTADSRGNVRCNIVMARSRLAPMKKMTIPRLELMAATLAVTIDAMIRRELELPLSESIFWTDSTIVLHYICNVDKRFRTFVANRIATIHDGSQPRQWRHVSTDLNPADDVSRGLKPDGLSDRWIQGPEFLWKPKGEWPIHQVTGNYDGENDPEVKSEAVFATQAESATTIDELLSRYSSWTRVKKAVAYLRRVGSFLRQKAGHNVAFDPADMSKPLSVKEMDGAEKAIFRFIQRKCFREEYRCLVNETDGRSKVIKSSRLARLDPEVTECGLLRVGGRLQGSTVATRLKHPVILPRKHNVVKLLIRHYHERCGHSGREHMMSLLRERCWILGARAAVREVLRDCVTCKRQRAQPGVQKMGNLPSERVTPSKPPFNFVGVDCFGPFYVKQGRNQLKRYGCVFTCLAVRAVHIEVLHSLETDAFINGLERFIARRGRPEVIWSDNGTNFVGADRELREGIQQWNQRCIHQFLLQREIEWKFNPPSASHMGGCWERQIRTIRKVMNALLKQQSLYDDSLATLMCKVESIINGRPLTVVSTDKADPEALTPNHLLLLRPNNTLPLGVFDEKDMYCRKRWKQVQYMADLFWRRWIREYLPTLQLRQKWTSASRNIAVGDIVLVVEVTPRNKWPMGRVTETHVGGDGLVRSANVKTSGGVMTRPISKLCLLECVEKSV